MGVDLGIVNIATDSEGEKFSGAEVNRNRRRRATARKQHQRKGSKRARRQLKAMSGRQRRFQASVNHKISKDLVEKAKALGVGIAIGRPHRRFAAASSQRLARLSGVAWATGASSSSALSSTTRRKRRGFPWS